MFGHPNKWKNIWYIMKMIPKNVMNSLETEGIKRSY